MLDSILLSQWESKFLPEDNSKSLEVKGLGKWQSVEVPHNWQDYQGYRGISHGDLHGTAVYRCELDPESVLVKDSSSIRLQFGGVSGTATILLNGSIIGEHTGTQVGFTIDLTHHWIRGKRNILEVYSRFLSTDEDQPFYCGGCKGTPFSEGAQPMGMFREVYLLIRGPLVLESNGQYFWSQDFDDKEARLRFRYEVSNISNREESACVRIELKDPEGKIVLSSQFPERVPPGKLQKSEHELPPLSDPCLWHPDNPKLYKAYISLISESDSVWDHEIITTGFRRFKWPTIALPDADHDVCSPSPSKDLVSDGLKPPTTENKFHNESVKKSTKGPAFSSGGIKVWTKHAEDSCQLSLDISLKQESLSKDEPVIIRGEITNDQGTVFYHQFEYEWDQNQYHFSLKHPRKWKKENPFLYRLTIDLLRGQEEVSERAYVRIAIKDDRPLSNASVPQYSDSNLDENPINKIPNADKLFRINGVPLAIQGTCAYETLLGADYSWGSEQIESFCHKIIHAGFNAFRDGHLPHHKKTYDIWDDKGILCWTQMGSHHYFDNDSFRENMRRAVRKWVRERRNHPSVFAWGLQNESIIPASFARELCTIIEEEDPTTGKDRLITTCNGGKGTHWNVPQEWSGTYGGNCNDFDLERAQLVGEYGSWRNFGKHTDRDYEGDENDFTESWACYSLGTKLRLGIENSHQAMGMFQWPFASFPNPGRSIERKEGTDSFAISPINSKGILTAWHQPTDAFYLYQSALLQAEKSPMVYIVSHTWSERWKTQGTKDRILVYSNCDEVELFNDIQSCSLGKKINPGPGKPFRWDSVPIEHNLLYAEGIVDGIVVAKDAISIENLPKAPRISSWIKLQGLDPTNLSADCYRLNCGGEDYYDKWGNRWNRDAPWNPKSKTLMGSLSWADDFEASPSNLASWGSTSGIIQGTQEQSLYQNYRFGRHRLRFIFDIPEGDYHVHIGIIEPWYGIGEKTFTHNHHRIFDIHLNDQKLFQEIDPWHLFGSLQAGRISAPFYHKGGIATVHFPKTLSGQVLIPWIALEPLK